MRKQRRHRRGSVPHQENQKRKRKIKRKKEKGCLLLDLGDEIESVINKEQKRREKRSEEKGGSESNRVVLGSKGSFGTTMAFEFKLFSGTVAKLDEIKLLDPGKDFGIIVCDQLAQLLPFFL